jgi:hypothetical protein
MSRGPCGFQSIMGGRRGARRDWMTKHRKFQHILFLFELLPQSALGTQNRGYMETAGFAMIR